MSTYHFKTNINSIGRVSQIKPQLDKLEQEHTIEHWHVNMNDPEYLLEVETNKLSPEEVKHLVREAGFEAEFTRAPQARESSDAGNRENQNNKDSNNRDGGSNSRSNRNSGGNRDGGRNRGEGR